MPTTEVKLVTVVAVALFDREGHVLIARRPEGKAMAGLWEFPGGKLEPGERPEQALVRELQEELGIHVQPEDLKPLTFASHGYDGFHLLMPVYTCMTWEGTVTAREHDQLAWVTLDSLRRYPMPAADEPLVTHLLALKPLMDAGFIQ